MPETARLTDERLFHDRQAAERAASFRLGRADLVFADHAYLDHESWIRPALAKLGDPKGKRALDYGYRRVAWYPDGTDGWAEAGLPLELVAPE